jgi:hypothetical protein
VDVVDCDVDYDVVGDIHDVVDLFVVVDSVIVVN